MKKIEPGGSQAGFKGSAIPVHPSGLRGYTGRASSSSFFVLQGAGEDAENGLDPLPHPPPPRHPPKRGSFRGFQGASPWLDLILLQDLIPSRKTVVGKDLPTKSLTS
jgi:hypothetical protein